MYYYKQHAIQRASWPYVPQLIHQSPKGLTLLPHIQTSQRCRHLEVPQQPWRGYTNHYIVESNRTNFYYQRTGWLLYHPQT